MFTELVHETNFTRQGDALITEFPRLHEVMECAEWQIGGSYTRFPLVRSNGPIMLYVWRSDDSDITEIPTIEVAYYYSADDGLIHLLGVRIVPENAS